MNRTPYRSNTARRTIIDVAILASTMAVVLAYVLHRFVGVGERPIVLGTLVLASILGWTQPAMRVTPRATPPARGRLTPVVVPLRRTQP